VGHVDDLGREAAQRLCVLFADVDHVEGQRDRRHRDVLLDRAALPLLARVVGVEDVPELTDDPAARRGRQAEHVGEADVLVDLLALAHALLLGRRQPHELRVQQVDGQRPVLPAHATVVGEEARAPFAHRPGGVHVECVHREEMGVLLRLGVLLALPGEAAVLRAKDGSRLSDRPSPSGIGHRHVVEEMARAAIPALPAGATVGTHVDGAPVARGDDVLGRGRRDREEVVVDVDLLGAALVGIEVDFVTRGEQKDRGEARERASRGGTKSCGLLGPGVQAPYEYRRSGRAQGSTRGTTL